MPEPHDATTQGLPPEGPFSRDPRPRADNLGRFRLLRKLGEGGMGCVYEAWDPRLQRRVAVKTLRHSGPEQTQRFFREARLQASVSHPGICQVFEVGEDADEPFIVMRLLAGRPLDEACRSLPLEQKLVLLRRTAEAVHEAHRQGLIHRDLKPSNILVETDADDLPSPVVVDFGIARAAGAEGGPTRSGDLIGTPAYMAPEQVRGEIQRLDRRTDVYALGATLYHLLAGRPPFPGSGTSLLLAVLHTDPPTLRGHGLPLDIEAVVFKCLEKEPDRRYASARDLAADLERFLDGRPVVARPVGRWYGLRNRLRRNPTAARIAAFSLALLLLSLSWGGWTAFQAERRERAARDLTEQVEEIEAQVRYSQLAPLHDTRPDRQDLRRRMERLARAIENSPPAGRPTGHYALGRGYLALGDLDGALPHLRLAWDDRPGDIEIGVALAQTLSQIYRRGIADAEIIGDWPARKRQSEELQRRFGHPARSILERLTTAPDFRRYSVDSGRDALLRALSLFHDDRFADALAVLNASRTDPEISARRPWDFEPTFLEGDVHRTWAARLDAEGDTEAALSHLDAARQAYARALEVAESEADVYLADAQAAFQAAGVLARLAQDGDEHLAHGLRRLDQALIAEPDSGPSRLWRARLHRAAAQHAMQRREDPSEPLAAALQAARSAAEDPSTRAAALEEVGRASWMEGKLAMTRGDDPSDAFERARSAFEDIPEADRAYTFWVSLGMVHVSAAEHAAGQGLPVTERFDAASAAFQTAAHRHSSPYAAWVHLGIGLFKASAVGRAGDPEDLLQRAVEALEDAARSRPDEMAPYYYLGLCRTRLARGADPAGSLVDLDALSGAEADLRRAYDLAPNRFHVATALGEIEHLRGIHLLETGGDPAPRFAAARDWYGKALEAAPGNPVPILNLAWNFYFEGKTRLVRNLDPIELLSQAEARLASIAGSRPSPGARLCAASILRLRGEWAALRDADPEPYWRPSERILADMATTFPDYAETFRSTARLWTRRGEREDAAGRDPAASWRRAEQALARAAALRPSNAYDELAAAQLAAAKARRSIRLGLDTDREHLLAAQEATALCLRRHPDWIAALSLADSLEHLSPRP